MISSELKILIVDDEKINLKVLSELLRSEAKISLANNGPDALEKAASLKPDIILLDVVMPGMSGFEVIDKLKKSEHTRAIPVIFITGLGDADNEEKGFELGSCDYIQKPFHAAIVKARVRLHLQLARQCILLEQLANIDPLTAIANRRKYEETFDHAWLTCQREQSDLVVAMLDIDYFKPYNDNYGHAAGDKTLARVARALKSQMRRPNDFLARYGGEEFVILSRGINHSGARTFLENCVAAIYHLNEPHSHSSHHRVTISIGGVSCIPGPNHSKSAILGLADKMLYQAKNTGRNCVKWRSIDALSNQDIGQQLLQA
jgi:diguanylate cyclase (GGDEF)-like protein